MKAPLTDEQKDLFEQLFFDLYTMYQNSMAWSDNGIPFRDRIENFMSTYNKHLVADACKKQRIGIGEKLKGEIDGSLWDSLFNHE